MFSSRTNWNLEPNRLARAIEAHRQSGRELLELTASNPTTCGFAYPEEEILAALADRRALVYAPESKGMRPARNAVATYYADKKGFAGSGRSVDPERILLVAGTSEAYSYLFRLLCEVGDELLVPEPSYPLFEFLAGLADVRLVPYPLVYARGWEMDLAALRAAITPRSRAVLVVHPNNPTGSFVKPREAPLLEALCAERGLAILADEVFLDYADGGAAPPSFAFSSAALTFTLSGLSKISALPQMKLAWIVTSGPETLVAEAVARLEMIADTYLSPGTPVQVALPKLLAVRRPLQNQLQDRIAANLAHLDEQLRSRPTVVRLDREGGWYAVLRVPATLPCDELAAALVERHSVLVHPGSFFDFPEEGYLVVSLILPAMQFAEGVRRLLEIFKR